MRVARLGLIAAAFLGVPDAVPALAPPCAQEGTEGGKKAEPTTAQIEALKAEFKRRREAVGKTDAAAHLELAKWCAGVGLKAEEKLVLKQILVFDKDHADARRLLGFVKDEAGKWVSEEEARKRKEKEEEQEKLRKGLVRYKGEWVAKEDVPMLEKGMVRRDGAWLSKEEVEKLEKGWKRVDGEWISPEEAPQLAQGLFKVDGKWVPIAEANRIRSDWEKGWRIPREHVLLRSNVERDAAETVANEAEAAYVRMKAVLGKDGRRLPVLVFGFRNVDEYNRYARQFGAHHASVYGAYFAVADEERPGVFVAGDKNAAPYNAAHAVGHAYVDQLLRGTGGEEEAEEAIPAWLEEGLATYVEKFHTPALRTWSCEWIGKHGGFASPKVWTKSFELSADDPDGSAKLIFQAGLLVTYYVETKDEKDRKLFADAVKAIAGGNPKDVARAAEALVRDGAALEKKIQAAYALK